MEWHIKYDQIIAGLKVARESGDSKKVNAWKRKLEKWQAGYGAYAPIR